MNFFEAITLSSQSIFTIIIIIFVHYWIMVIAAFVITIILLRNYYLFQHCLTHDFFLELKIFD